MMMFCVAALSLNNLSGRPKSHLISTSDIVGLLVRECVVNKVEFVTSISMMKVCGLVYRICVYAY